MLNFMKELLDKFLDKLQSVFPLSPFAEPIAKLASMPFLGYLNWFIPFGSMLKIASLWLVAIGLYYAYMVIARWVKLLGD